ncbi:hypothetical protein [Paenibacillus sp. Soil522]|uniref:hypothetical protein n=1 Tax=Paenibacillus sp. Soil522 TaxID=1736388 RepID=UPI0006FF0AC1|nr:hypothetical protein [Paenibacillus sp. Soil522]KRE45828.1 hypothetical protein ASG81_12425 [Paenibacillus sp. Soil522]
MDAKSVINEINELIESGLGLDPIETFPNGPKKGKEDFYYQHYILNHAPWNLKNLMMRIRCYNIPTEACTQTRVEFGFSQRDAKLSDPQKNALRKMMRAYAELHGYEVKDNENFKIHREINNNKFLAIEETIKRLTGLFKDMDKILQTLL